MSCRVRTQEPSHHRLGDGALTLLARWTPKVEANAGVALLGSIATNTGPQVLAYFGCVLEPSVEADRLLRNLREAAHSTITRSPGSLDADRNK